MTPTKPRPITVLVVDDDPEQVDLLTRLVSHSGMVALPAYSGRQCLQQARRRAVDAIVLNVVMPEMSGLEVCAALRGKAATRSVPIILLTAKDDTATRREAMRLGASEFVAKPARGQDLLARIRTQVEAGRKVRALERALAPKKPPRAKK